eukprot:CAMPEP_0197578102 /NCGR_PEP_ID=MMETSP1326-20131121/2471_1 /TAXON_ID=1155430 /ORGANISM="Genus nov. species nov., Strain RCC2288" /LENGTH=138 /DNA_ID=CAMNT_0043141261 /DNA_START=258 /DNA_END=670 /DNA_ORIENTATION=+
MGNQKEPAKVLISGWLTKKGSANAFSSGNTWRRRYFMLFAPTSSGHGAVLRYFTSDATTGTPRGDLAILPGSAVRVLDTEASLVEHGLNGKFLGKRLFAFHSVPARGEREIARSAFILEAETTATMQSWVTALAEIVS